MKIAILGAAGDVGKRSMYEALARGHNRNRRNPIFQATPIVWLENSPLHIMGNALGFTHAKPHSLVQSACRIYTKYT